MTQATALSAESQYVALRQLAANARWNWHQPTSKIINSLPTMLPGQHPLAAVETLSAQPDAWQPWWDKQGDQVMALVAELDEKATNAPVVDVAYYSPEFGIAAEIPQYSGGLGILAGDHLKSASDLGIGLVGVGLFYHSGFFRQEIEGAAQRERYETVDADLVGAFDTGSRVRIPVGDEMVVAAVRELHVGVVRLLLLDTNVPENSEMARNITDRLYSGDRTHRLHQELILGVGGLLAVRARGLAPSVHHLNEGHASLFLLELLAEEVEQGRSFADAAQSVREATLFTTHTPVPAGIDRFERSLIRPYLTPWATRIGVSVDQILDWATLPDDGPSKPFNTAALAFEFAGRANGVSQLHASVSRKLFASLPKAAEVEGLTNGVHARTWVNPELQSLYDEVLGEGWENGAPEAWAQVTNLPQAEFARIRQRAKAQFVASVEASTGVALDPEQNIVGFARRFATYKRAALLLQDPDGLERTLASGAQFVFAGKAHPADDEGKAVIAELARFAGSSAAEGQIVLVPDYDIEIARAMYFGVDVWLNNPIRPREASGTSGEKAALNGVLNASILDGWWADWFKPGIGWVIPSSPSEDPVERDRFEAVALHEVLVDEVMAQYRQSDQWWATTLEMLAHLGPLVTAGRMVAEYNERFYVPIRRGS